jgi:hypothetical protein
MNPFDSLLLQLLSFWQSYSLVDTLYYHPVSVNIQNYLSYHVKLINDEEIDVKKLFFFYKSIDK